MVDGSDVENPIEVATFDDGESADDGESGDGGDESTDVSSRLTD